MTRRTLLLLPMLLALAGVAPAHGQNAGGETVQQALCRLIDSSARARDLPIPFLTRLIWRESAFRMNAVSPVGAQGVAQFMPGTARERGLLDPFDPEQAIPHAAHFIADLRRQFGNLGLAAAAYNGGPGRVSKWLTGSGGLPVETRAYVIAVTGRTAEDWRGGSSSVIEMAPEEPKTEAEKGRAGPDEPASETADKGSAMQETAKPDPKKSETKKGDEAKAGMAEGLTCMQVTAALRMPSRGDRFMLPPEGGVAAPWGIQLAGNFSKSLALQSFNRTRDRYAGVIGSVRPMIIGTRLLSRGTRAFYRIRIPAETRQAADTLCGRIRGAGGACIVLRT